MTRMASHKRVLGLCKGKLPHVQQKRLDKIKLESNVWTPTWTADKNHHIYEVRRHNTSLGVNLSLQTCSCQVWQLTGMPCAHAIAAIAARKEKPEDYVHQ